jgi:hypothetical protein
MPVTPGSLGDMYEYFVLETLAAVWVYNGKGFGNRRCHGRCGQGKRPRKVAEPISISLSSGTQAAIRSIIITRS